MTEGKCLRWTIVKTVILLLLGGYPAGQLLAATCTEGVAEPPFLSYGKVPPNVLLMIDNSGSMYDMAYLEDATYCYDDNYTSTDTYAGYFEPKAYYQYNLTTDKFEDTGGTPAYTICDNAGDPIYINAAAQEDSHACVTITVNADGSQTLTSFAAKGNFLNWTVSSKFDIEKKILTGGKYDNNTLVMENRGCADRRFIKQVDLLDKTNSINYLTMAVRPPYEEEMTDSSDATSRIEIFEVSAEGFDMDPCQGAVEELQKDSPSQGTFKSFVDACMDYDDTTGGADALDNRVTTFNHSLHFCWYKAGNGEWPPGVGAVTSIMNDCEQVYKDGGLAPTITPDNPAYVCYGIYDADKTPDARLGYVGRCWEPSEPPEGCNATTCAESSATAQATDSPYHTPFCGEDGFVYDCDGSFNSNKGTCGGSPGEFVLQATGDCNGTPTTPQWTDDYTEDPDSCVEQALIDYCQMLNVPEVIDPSDLASQSGEFWNLPSVLVDSGVLAQKDEPIAIIKGLISKSTAPAGLLQEVNDDLRLGAMIFNDDGAASECASNENIYIDDNSGDCSTSRLDGGRIISDLNDSNSAGYIDNLVKSINDIKATSWTPLAEAMYNAIGYYGQDTTRRINTTDFNATEDPVDYWCQNNNVLFLTEGASTADLNQNVLDFISSGRDDSDGDNASTTCSALSGSTFLDDLAYYANNSNAADLYTIPQLDGEDKRNIKTYVVSSGSLRATGSDECSPDILMENTALNGGTTLLMSNDADELEYNLRRVFSEITNKASSGSAASVISSSRSGEGAMYQAIFWPSKEPEDSSSSLDPIKWVGNVHALFVDEAGRFHEDTDGDRILSSNDKRVVLYYDEAAQSAKACYEYDDTGSCIDSRPLQEVRYLWSAANWLGKISNNNFSSYNTDDIYTQRPLSTFTSNTRQRYIFTWNDLNNDGITDQNEIIDFVGSDGYGGASDWGNSTLTVSNNRGDVIHDFGVSTNAEVNAIVNWIRGADNATIMRSRKTVRYYTDDNSTKEITWRLGDVVHSTPTSVSRPAENLHFLYRDNSYAAFAKKYRDRRHVIYFGANDGMLHAINGGFYNGLKNKFCQTANCTDESTAMELGAELWAYVPYNLLPHLQCLTDKDYDQEDHKYYVDMKPRILDARIFPDDDDHPNGWGTLLVGGMRFGGSPVEAYNLNGVATDDRIFRSAYFFLDITNPEKPPVLLGETTSTTDSGEVNLGYTVTAPTAITMKKDADDQRWYLVMGTGPTNVMGESDQPAKLVVFPLDWLHDLPAEHPAVFTTYGGYDGGKRSLRIKDKAPRNATEIDEYLSGAFPIQGSDNGFISSMITVDYELTENYKSDIVYFAAVEGNFTSGWRGGLYRLVTRDTKDVDSTTQSATIPYSWAALSQPSSGFSDYDLKPLIKTDRPITAPASVGQDNNNNIWIYFGTGRFYHGNDKSDSTRQYYYGIKEPIINNEFRWDEVEVNGTGSDPGLLGLLRTDQIKVVEHTFDGLICDDGTGTITYTCLPNDGTVTITSLDGLEQYINEYTDGWYRELPDPRERNLGQATLLGGLLTFTSYQPYEELCRAQGVSHLYGIYYLTGTAWKEHILSADNLEIDDEYIKDKTELGIGLSLTPNLHVGRTEKGPTAMVQTSTGEIREITQETQPYRNFRTGRASWEQR